MPIKARGSGNYVSPCTCLNSTTVMHVPST